MRRDAMTDGRISFEWIIQLEALNVSDAAFRHWVGSIAYCSEHLPSGRFEMRQSRFFSPAAFTESVVEELVAAGCWERISETEFQLVKWTPPAARRFQRIPLPWQMRRAVLERDGYVCGICGLEVDEADLHIDHIVPVSKGGANDLTNLQVTHSFCNMKKSDRE